MGCFYNHQPLIVSGGCFQEAFRAFHLDLNYIKKFLQPIRLGRLEDEATVEDKDKMVMADFEELTKTAHKLVSVGEEK